MSNHPTGREAMARLREVFDRVDLSKNERNKADISAARAAVSWQKQRAIALEKIPEIIEAVREHHRKWEGGQRVIPDYSFILHMLDMKYTDANCEWLNKQIVRLYFSPPAPAKE